MKPILKGPILYHKYVVYLPVLLTAFFYLNSTWMHQTHKFLKAVGEHTLLLHTTWLLTAAQLAFRAVKCEIILNSHPLPELLVVLLLQLPVRTASLQPKSPLLQSTASQTKCNSQRACAYAFQCKIKALPRPCPHSISLAPRGVAHAAGAASGCIILYKLSVVLIPPFIPHLNVLAASAMDRQGSGLEGDLTRHFCSFRTWTLEKGKQLSLSSNYAFGNETIVKLLCLSYRLY